VLALVVVPTYNEADNIGPLLDRLLPASTGLHVLVVDDSSPDGTAEVVRRRPEHGDRLHLLSRAAKEGLGPAYLEGFRRALEDGYDVIVQMDADGSHDPADVPRLIDATSEADLVVGSRYVAGGRIDGWARSRLLLSWAGNRYAQLLLPVGVRDLTGGFKAWRAALLKEVVATPIDTRGYGFQIETTVAAVRLGGRVTEVPITFRDRERGHSKMTARIAAEAAVAVPRARRGIRSKR